MKKVFLLLSTFLLISCTSNQAPPDLNMVISVSSDGHYAIATNTNKQAILWDLQNHSYKIVFKDANIYSAYFIKNTDDFMYQNDKTNEVVIENVDGKIIKTFNPGFPTYGEIVTSDLKAYFTSDRWFQLYKTDLTTNQTKQFFYYYCGPNYKDETPPPTGMPYACQEFVGSSQLFGLNLTPNDKTLISTASGAMYLWNVATAKQEKLIVKNDAQTVAAISPDGSYLVTADANLMGYYYSLKNQEGYNFFITTPSQPETDSYFYYYRTYEDGHQEKAATANLINNVLSIKFIDQDHMVIIFHGVPQSFNFGGLYDIQNMAINPKYWTKKIQIPVKYLPLIPNAATDQNVQGNWPLVGDTFSRDQAIDTSPSAHILVMSQQNANGIIVYKYDPGSQTLTRIWTGTVKPWWQLW